VPSKKNKKARQKLPTSRSLLANAAGIARENRGAFAGLIGIYFLLSLLAVKGLGLSSNFSEVKDTIYELAGADANKLGLVFGLYGYAVTSSSLQAGSLSGAYQVFFALITSLAAIWMARQAIAGKSPKLKDSFYKGMYPIIPFILILFVIGIQLIPATVGNFLLGTVFGQGLAVGAIEKTAWITVFLLALGLSLYFIASSIFALYISALPDMTPLRALRSARGLVRGRRLKVGLRIAAVIGFLLLVSIAVVIPLIVIASWSVEFAVLALGGFSLVFFHTYMYLLYRSLL
jgi:hypothetical protein